MKRALIRCCKATAPTAWCACATPLCRAALSCGCAVPLRLRLRLRLGCATLSCGCGCAALLGCCQVRVLKQYRLQGLTNMELQFQLAVRDQARPPAVHCPPSCPDARPAAQMPAQLPPAVHCPDARPAAPASTDTTGNCCSAQRYLQAYPLPLLCVGDRRAKERGGQPVARLRCGGPGQRSGAQAGAQPRHPGRGLRGDRQLGRRR